MFVCRCVSIYFGWSHLVFILRYNTDGALYPNYIAFIGRSKRIELFGRVTFCLAPNTFFASMWFSDLGIMVMVMVMEVLLIFLADGAIVCDVVVVVVSYCCCCFCCRFCCQ